MIPEISEFSYGFALTNEVVGWGRLNAAPIFPSLIEEGKAGGGYDVRLDFPAVPLYLQFKRADCMTRSTAREISQHRLAIDLPFYRFPVTESDKSAQHILLFELDEPPNQVYYAAPRFHKLESINEAWNAKEVAARSLFVSPREIGILKPGPHTVSYDRRRTYLCSEPKRIPFETAASLAEKLSLKLDEDRRPLRLKLPELTRSLDTAWARAKQRMSAQENLLSHTVGFRVPGPPVDSGAGADRADVVPIRPPKLLSDEKQQLRLLADHALSRFEAQLVIVQTAP